MVLDALSSRIPADRTSAPAKIDTEKALRGGEQVGAPREPAGLILERYPNEANQEMALLRRVVEQPGLLAAVSKLWVLRKKLGREKFVEVNAIKMPDLILATIRRS